MASSDLNYFDKLCNSFSKWMTMEQIAKLALTSKVILSYKIDFLNSFHDQMMKGLWNRSSNGVIYPLDNCFEKILYVEINEDYVVDLDKSMDKLRNLSVPCHLFDEVSRNDLEEEDGRVCIRASVHQVFDEMSIPTFILEMAQTAKPTQGESIGGDQLTEQLPSSNRFVDMLPEDDDDKKSEPTSTSNQGPEATTKHDNVQLNAHQVFDGSLCPEMEVTRDNFLPILHNLPISGAFQGRTTFIGMSSIATGSVNKLLSPPLSLESKLIERPILNIRSIESGMCESIIGFGLCVDLKVIKSCQYGLVYCGILCKWTPEKFPYSCFCVFDPGGHHRVALMAFWNRLANNTELPSFQNRVTCPWVKGEILHELEINLKRDISGCAHMINFHFGGYVFCGLTHLLLLLVRLCFDPGDKMSKSTLLYSLTLEDKGDCKEAGRDSVAMETIWDMLMYVSVMTKISSMVSGDITITYLVCLLTILSSMMNLMFGHHESDVLKDVGEHSISTVTILVHPFDLNLVAMFDEVVFISRMMLVKYGERKHLATECLLIFDPGRFKYILHHFDGHSLNDRHMNVVFNVLACSASLQCDPEKKKSLSSYYSSDCKDSKFKCNASVIIWVFDPGGNAKYKLLNFLLHSPSFKRGIFAFQCGLFFSPLRTRVF